MIEAFRGLVIGIQEHFIWSWTDGWKDFKSSTPCFGCKEDVAYCFVCKSLAEHGCLESFIHDRAERATQKDADELYSCMCECCTEHLERPMRKFNWEGNYDIHRSAAMWEMYMFLVDNVPDLAEFERERIEKV